jgi:3D (Asp-Asp-Asp) domain-containing protein
MVFEVILFPLMINFSFAKLRKLIKKSPVEFTLLVLMTVVLGYGVLPTAVMADEKIGDTSLIALKIEAMQNTMKPYGVLPKADLRGPSYTITVPSTAYNSEVGQTDSTPFITASGTTVRPGVIAANFLPIGTRIKIPKYYGEQVFVVEDRMNARYNKRIDIWMTEHSDAIAWGIRNVEIEVYNN